MAINGLTRFEEIFGLFSPRSTSAGIDHGYKGRGEKKLQKLHRGISGTYLRAPLKPLIPSKCPCDVRGVFQGDTWLPRDYSLSDSCTSGRCICSRLGETFPQVSIFRCCAFWFCLFGNYPVEYFQGIIIRENFSHSVNTVHLYK